MERILSGNYTEEPNNLLRRYAHDIRNSKILSKENLIEINNMSYEDRATILSLYNEMMVHYSTIIEDLHKDENPRMHK